MNNCDLMILILGNIDLVELEIFKPVADLVGVTRAAAKLGREHLNVTT